MDDGTADYEPDFYTDGTKIYAVWQNAKEGLTEEMSLNEIADSLTLHVAVYDKGKNEFVSLGSIGSENGLFQQNPQIVADGDNVSVFWYENKEDNVLGLSGTNKIYQAILQDAYAAFDRSEIQSVEEEEPDVEDTDTKDTGAEDLDVEELDAEDANIEDFDTEEPEYNGILESMWLLSLTQKLPCQRKTRRTKLYPETLCQTKLSRGKLNQVRLPNRRKLNRRKPGRRKLFQRTRYRRRLSRRTPSLKIR